MSIIFYRKLNSEFFKSKIFRLFASVFILFFISLIVLLLQYIEKANAQISSFYPSSCLGGWQNVDKATGPADALNEDDIFNYSDENSASVFNSVAEIFCGGFQGEIPQDALHKKVVLNFSWATEPPVSEEPGEIADDEPTGVEEALEEELVEDAADESVDEPTENISGENPDEQPLEIIPEPDPATEETAEPEPLPEEENIPEAEVEEPVSFLQNYFFSLAYAEEPEEQGITENQNINEEEDISETEDEEGIDTIDALPNTIIEVQYTLDGTEWKSLGYVSEINNDIQFELPIEEFENIADLERLQIALRTLSSFDVTPKIYLDSMWLEVEYDEVLTEENPVEEILGQVIGAEEEATTEEENEELLEEEAEEQEEQIIENVPVLPVLSVRNFQKDILIDKEASHSCKSIPFKVNISGVDTYILPLVLEKAVEDLYELEIGSLPNGVDVTFAKNNQYIYSPEANESEVDLKITNEIGSQKGDFNVSVIFSKKDTNDSSVICQINIINQ